MTIPLTLQNSVSGIVVIGRKCGVPRSTENESMENDRICPCQFV